MGIQELLMLMGEGNAGAIVVLLKLFEQNEIGIILDLDDMDIRGEQIWVGFKDFSNQKLDVFKDAVRSRNKEMISMINSECFPKMAVTKGASFKKGGHTAFLIE